MARSLSPFTRITLLISELKSNKIEDLTDVKKCDLLHHTAKLHEVITDSSQKESALVIGEQGQQLFSSIQSGEFAKAETQRQTLVSACKQLKELL